MKFLKLNQIIILGLLATNACTPSLHGMGSNSTPTTTQQETRRTRPRAEHDVQDLVHSAQPTNEEQKAQLNDLPDEIILTILHQAAHDYEELNAHNYANLLGTSRRFRNLLKSPAQDLFIRLPQQENLTEENLSTLPPSTKALDLSFGSGIDYIRLVTIAKHCPHLTNLNLMGCTFITPTRPAGLGEVFSPTWTNLNLSNTNIDNFNLMIIAACCTRLSELGLSHCSNISADGLNAAIAFFSPTLTFLNLSGTKIDGNGLQALAARCPILSGLDMAGCTNITQGRLANIPTTLTYLNLTNTNINDNDLLTIITRCPNLTELILSKCRNITAAGLAAAISQLPAALIAIDLSGTNIDGNGLRKLALHCQNLEELHLSNCDNLTWHEFAAIVKSFSPNLTYLTLGNNINSTGLLALARRKNLACLKIYDNTIIPLFFKETFHRLRREHEMKPCYLEINHNI